MLKATEKIWHNGKLIDWNDAKIHVLAHVLHYGSSVFEGIRCYATPAGPAIFRGQEHMRRLFMMRLVERPLRIVQLTAEGRALLGLPE